MTEENSNLFQNQDTASTEPLESDFVDQMNEEDQLALKKKLFGEIRKGIKRNEEKKKYKTRILLHSKIAASVLLILSLHIGLWQALKLQHEEYQTGANETLKVELPDGSIALLNSNSSLNYSYNWVLGFERKVELKGEAYFEIAKDAESRRFVINEGDVMEVEVFGTEFNFKNQHPIHKLTLLEGSVKLGYQNQNGSTHRMVQPGETIKLNPENHQLETKTVEDPIRLLSWQKRKLSMQNQSLEEVLSIVKELYDLEIKDQNIPATKQLISGSLPLTDNPTEVLENIEVLFDTKINVEQNPIRIQ